MCNDKKGLGAPPKPDKIKKVNLLSGENPPPQDVLDKYKYKHKYWDGNAA